MPTHDDVRESTRPQQPAIPHDDLDPLPVVAALQDIVAAVRDLADHAPVDPRQLLRAEQVAELLQLPARTVRARAAAGAIPHRRFGKHYRFSLADVEHIVQAMECNPQQRHRPLRAA